MLSSLISVSHSRRVHRVYSSHNWFHRHVKQNKHIGLNGAQPVFPFVGTAVITAVLPMRISPAVPTASCMKEFFFSASFNRLERSLGETIIFSVNITSDFAMRHIVWPWREAASMCCESCKTLTSTDSEAVVDWPKSVGIAVTKSLASSSDRFCYRNSSSLSTFFFK